MVCLIKVPAEILLQIISEFYTPACEHEPPTGLASLSALSRTSSTLHAVATPILYGSFIGTDTSNGRFMRSGRDTANAKFLRTIVSRPDLAALTTNAVFKDLVHNTRQGECSHLDPNFLEESAVLVTAVIRSLGLPHDHPLMTGSNLLPGSKPGQQPAFKYCPAVTAILILYHLPKLRHLTFSSPLCFYALEETFNSWVFIESGCLTPPPPFFAELKTFSREHPDTEGAFSAQMLLAPMLCPKIEEIRVHMSDMDSESWGVLGYLHGRRSSVKCIFASYSSWDGEGIGYLLDVASSLEDFEYHHGGAPVGYSNFVPLAVGAALQKVKATLRRLVIAVERDDLYFTHGEEGWGCDQGWIGDLSRFSQLRILELSANLLMRESGAWSVDTLPPGVEDLTLRCDRKDWTALYPLTLDILRRCRSLKRFRLSAPYYTYWKRLCMVSAVQREALEKAGAAAGVVVVFFNLN